MIAGLLWKDRAARWDSGKDPFWEDCYRDLNLDPVIRAMGAGDRERETICRQMLESPLSDREAILYRQEILKDCIRNPQPLERIYEICQEAEENRKNTWCRLTSPHLTTVYSSAEDLLKIYMEALVSIRRTLEKESFESQGVRHLSKSLSEALSDSYLMEVRSLKPAMESRDGMEISAGFGPYLQGISYVRRQPLKGLEKLRWLIQPSYTLGARDMKGAKDLELREDRAINEVANVMAQAAGNLQSLVDQIRKEFSFYLGGVSLWRKVKENPERLCFPELTEGKARKYVDIYDGAMALEGETRIIGNTVTSENQQLWLITGANQGGKTTFLRSIGLCQLMAQCGLFVFARDCRIPIRKQIFTHFGREEDRTLSSGKLEEELLRMSEIVDHIHPGAMVLSNESFASTNDRDGSEILEGIVRGLMEKDIEVFAVTHLMDFAESMAGRQTVLSLRPERRPGGERTYRLREEMPLPDAYGADLYRRIFENTDASGNSQS